LEQGLINENILDLPEEQRPEVINDIGRQMKAKPVKKMFEDHCMPQLFSRPRTPNDNPFIESMFSTLKGSSQYHGRFLDLDHAVEYFSTYFPCYDSEHLHSGIDYVTPISVTRAYEIKLLLAAKHILLINVVFARRLTAKNKIP
jgi:transposase InsO family protein